MIDRDILIAFQRTHSQESFARIVQQHTNLVYAHARRMVKEPAAAEDITQEVFLTLFRESSRLNRDTPLVGWLFVTTRHRALEYLRAATRRKEHERKAAMSHDAAHEPDPTWKLIAEEVDGAVAELSPDERHAILLRYFSGKSSQEIAVELSISEDAARKRVQRAVESLRGLLTRRGLAVPVAALTVALATHAAAEAAPVALAATIASSATLIPTSAVTTAKGALVLMTLKTKIVAAAIILAVAFPVTYVAVHVISSAPPAVPTAVVPREVPESQSSSLPAVVSGGREAESVPAPYLLAAGESLKYISDPPADIRRRMLESAGLNELAEQNMPSILFEQKKGQLTGNCKVSRVPFEMGELVEFCLGCYPPAIEGDPGKLAVIGDWVFREDSSQEDRRAALENILQQQLHQPITLVYRDVPREVIVLKGDWKYARPKSPHMANAGTPVLDLYETAISDRMAGVGVGKSDVFVGELGEYLHQQVVMDGKGFPKSVTWIFNADPTVVPKDPAAVLDHVKEQTGLTWSKETRTVRRLFFEGK